MTAAYDPRHDWAVEDRDNADRLVALVAAELTVRGAAARRVAEVFAASLAADNDAF